MPFISALGIELVPSTLGGFVDRSDLPLSYVVLASFISPLKVVVISLFALYTSRLKELVIF